MYVINIIGIEPESSPHNQETITLMKKETLSSAL